MSDLLKEERRGGFRRTIVCCFWLWRNTVLRYPCTLWSNAPWAFSIEGPASKLFKKNMNEEGRVFCCFLPCHFNILFFQGMCIPLVATIVFLKWMAMNHIGHLTTVTWAITVGLKIATSCITKARELPIISKMWYPIRSGELISPFHACGAEITEEYLLSHTSISLFWSTRLLYRSCSQAIFSSVGVC